MVQSLGITVGNLNSYVAAGQGGGIEILLNEYSNRATPSMVAFTDHSRSIGVDAFSNQMMNLKNTIYDLMVLIGKTFKEIDASTYPFKLEEASDGQPMVVVRHLGEERKFTITQVLAMLFTKLRGIAYDSTNCVISCPQFFTEQQKDALLQAALLSGLKPLQIISDMSSVVLNYAYYRTTREDTHKFIAFINLGQSNLQCCIAWLTPKEDIVRILAAESERIGGKDFDKLLADHFVKEGNLNLNTKQYLKLISSCEKLKKLLSSNANEIPIHVESLISEDQDFTARMDRATYEKVVEHLLQQVETCFRRLLSNAKLNFDTLMNPFPSMCVEESSKCDEKSSKCDEDSPKKDEEPSNCDEDTMKCDEIPSTFELQAVEMVGGSTRTPAIRHLVQSVFNMAPSTTLNTDEAVARGCVLQCATLLPSTKIKREIKILGDEFFYTRNVNVDKDMRRVELELITSDRKYKLRTEARNNLEEYIYLTRSKLQDGDPFMDKLNEKLEWLFSDEGLEAAEDDYNSLLNELKKASDDKLVENNSN